MRSRQGRSASAFTLLEMLAATALSAVLMIAVLSVIRSTARTQRALAAAEVKADDYDSLVQLLRQDLLACRSFKIKENSLLLEGYGAIDPTTCERRYLPAAVAYEILTVQEHRWLVRRQIDPTHRDAKRGWIEPLWPRVATFTIKSIDKEKEGQGGQGRTEHEAQKVQDDTVPRSAALLITFQDEGQRPFERVIHLR